MTRLRCFLPAALLSLASIALASPGSFTIDQVMSAPFATHLSASPNGRAVIWILNERGARNIWIASAPDWQGRKLTHFDSDDGQEIDELSWSPDGKTLFFTRGGDFENPGEPPNPALSPIRPQQAIWSVPADASTPAKKLTDGRAPAVSPHGDTIAFLRAGQIYFMKTDGPQETQGAPKLTVNDVRAGDLLWSPDGAFLAFVSNRKNHSFIGLYHPADQSLRYLDPSVDRDTDPVWSPDSTHIAYVHIPASTRAFAFGPEREAEPWSLRMTDVASNHSTEIFHADPGPGSFFHGIEAEQQLLWAAGDRIIFPWEKTGWAHLYSVSAAGHAAATDLTPGDAEVANAVLSPNRDKVFYSSNLNDIDRRHLWSVSVSGSAPEQLTHGEAMELDPTPLAGDSTTAFLAASYNEKEHAMVRTADRQSKALAPNTIPADFPAASLVKPELIHISAADGLEIHAQLFLPPTNTGARHPALVFFHGGSRRQMFPGFHYMYYYSNAYALNQYFANQGYVVLSVNYRSGIGYGLNFREALNYGATGASEFNDVLGAGLYLRSRPDVDPARIGVWGGSYGGYLTGLALSRASDLFAAGVDFHGVHDWNLEIPNFVPAYNPGEHADAARLAFESSPLASVSGWRSPVLLIHGDDDRNVPFVETIALVEALRRQHVPFEELIFPNEIHDFLLQRDWVTAYHAAADFFARKLNPSTTTSSTTAQ